MTTLQRTQARIRSHDKAALSEVGTVCRRSLSQSIVGVVAGGGVVKPMAVRRSIFLGGALG